MFSISISDSCSSGAGCSHLLHDHYPPATATNFLYTFSSISTSSTSTSSTSSSNLSRLPSLRDLLDPDDDVFEFQTFFNTQQSVDPDHQTMPPEKEQQHEELQEQVQMMVKQQQQRPPKRDRHSKIVTARGLRDRRMRLSLEVAKKFFGLQDLLGYEKASKTVEWLLLQANPEINKLMISSSLHLDAAASSSSSSTSSSEPTSSSCEIIKADDHQNKKKKVMKSSALRRISGKGVCKLMRDERRAKARERAKARTIAKNNYSCNDINNNNQDHHHQHSGVPTISTSNNLNMMMMLKNILGANISNYHQHSSSPQPQGHDQVTGLVSSFGRSWEASL